MPITRRLTDDDADQRCAQVEDGHAHFVADGLLDRLAVLVQALQQAACGGGRTGQVFSAKSFTACGDKPTREPGYAAIRLDAKQLPSRLQDIRPHMGTNRSWLLCQSSQRPAAAPPPGTCASCCSPAARLQRRTQRRQIKRAAAQPRRCMQSWLLPRAAAAQAASQRPAHSRAMFAVQTAAEHSWPRPGRSTHLCMSKRPPGSRPPQTSRRRGRQSKGRTCTINGKHGSHEL